MNGNGQLTDEILKKIGEHPVIYVRVGVVWPRIRSNPSHHATRILTLPTVDEAKEAAREAMIEVCQQIVMLEELKHQQTLAERKKSYWAEYYQRQKEAKEREGAESEAVQGTPHDPEVIASPVITTEAPDSMGSG